MHRLSPFDRRNGNLYVVFTPSKYLFDGLFLKLNEIETVEIHHLVPRRREIMNKLFSGVVRRVNFG